jgi:DNA repair photolyase
MGKPRPTDDPAVKAALVCAMLREDHPLVSSVTETETKTLVIKNPSDDGPFGTLYNLNLYRGCGHGCIYCDSRSECYGIIDISRIEIKRNAIALLRKELSRKRQKGVICTGSMNDPYMLLEAEVGLTRQALEVVLERGFGIHVITKSTLVLRDIDLLAQLAAKTHATVSFSVTTCDDALAARIEPGASPPSERIRAIQALRQAGVHAGALMMPFLPGLTDGEENIRTLVRSLQAQGAEYAVPGCLTLRDTGKAYYYARLARINPAALAYTKSIYGDRYLPPEEWAGKVWRLAAECVQVAGMSLEAPKWRPPEVRQLGLFSSG